MSRTPGIARIAPGITLALALGAHVVAAQSNTPTRSVGGSPLASPSTLTDLSPDPRTAEFRLTAAPGRLALVPGSLTDVYVYNGRVPGPTMIVSPERI